MVQYRHTYPVVRAVLNCELLRGFAHVGTPLILQDDAFTSKID